MGRVMSLSRHSRADPTGAPHPIAKATDVEPIQDFAFADTIAMADLDASTVQDSSSIDGGEVEFTPLATTTSSTSVWDDHRVATRVGIAWTRTWTRVRDAVEASRREMLELWNATASIESARDHRVDVQAAHPLARVLTVGRRIRALWSLFEWDRADVVRAASIGLVVFMVVATVGSFIVHATARDRSQPTTPSGVGVGPN